MFEANRFRCHWLFCVFFSCGFVGAALSADLEPTEYGKFTFTCLEIRDVMRGAGLAVVMETPSGKTYLYDVGNGYPEKGGWVGDYNAARDTVAPFLKSKGIEKLDGVIISHAHYDHFGG